MKVKTTIGALVLSGSLFFGAVPSLAVQFPNSYWALDTNYQNAVNANDYYGIINYGKQEIEMMEGLPEGEDTYGVLGSRTINVANAYEALGDYEGSIPYHQKYIKYAEHFGWTDGVKISTAKISAYASDLDLYTLSDTPVVTYGAKFEPVSGTYFGQVYGASESRDSMILIYQEYGESSTLAWLNMALSEASAGKKAVELALNFPYEGGQLDSIISDTSFIDSLCDILKEHPDLKIFLRIGAEMNVWTNLPDPDKYKSAFITVANAVRSRIPNAAIVWSVGHTSSNLVNMEDFYPGDEYVDWVGISAYGVKYFLGERPGNNINEIVFKAGVGADPVNIVSETVRKFGDRKPIMLAEGGSTRYTNGSINEDSTEWAVLNIKRFYSTVLMKYPQIKLMAYFNQVMPNEMQFFDMNSEMQAAYWDMTSREWFIQNGSDSAKSFSKLGDTIPVGDSLEVYALPYVYGDQQPRVDYSIDDTWVNASLELPYKTVLDFSGLSDGLHTLKVNVTSGDASKITKTYTISKSGGAGVKPSAPANSVQTGFTDTGSLSEEQANAVKFATEQGIIEGYDDGTFLPNGKLTRAEFATMVCRAFGYAKNGRCSFDDAKEHWASEYIKACYDAGAISGVGGNDFAPDSNVQLDQAAKILTVCSGLVTGDIPKLSYPDAFLEAGSAAGMFVNITAPVAKPQTEITRIDAAVMFSNIVKK